MSELGQSIARALAARGVAGVQVDVPLARLTSFRIGGPGPGRAAGGGPAPRIGPGGGGSEKRNTK